MLKSRGCYTIELSDGNKVPLLFNTMTLAVYCEKHDNMPLAQLYQLIQEGFTIKQYFSLFLCAAEEFCNSENKECSFTERDAAIWVDELGGIASEKFYEVLTVINSSVAGKTEAKNGQKKTVPMKS